MSSSFCRSTSIGAGGCGPSGFITAGPTRIGSPRRMPRYPTSTFWTLAGAATGPAAAALAEQAFLNLRLSPVNVVKQTPEHIRQTVRQLVHQSENPWLTGVCCINMDEQVTDEQVAALLDEVESLRAEYGKLEDN